MKIIKLLGIVCLIGAIIPIASLIYWISEDETYLNDWLNAGYAILVVIYIIASKFWAFIDPDLSKIEKENKLLKMKLEQKALKKKIEND